MCARLGLDKLFPPARIARRPSKAFAATCILALVGYALVSITCLYLCEFSAPLSYYSALVAWGALLGFIIHRVLSSSEKLARY